MIYEFYVNEKRTDIKANMPKKVYEIMKDLVNIDQESFWLITLNTQNDIIKIEMLFLGGIDNTAIDPKIIFKRILEHGAAGFLICHNHPSGSYIPSQEDKRITETLKNIAEILTLRFIDHIIIGEGYFSFVENKIF